MTRIPALSGRLFGVRTPARRLVSALTPGYEFQDLLFTVSGSPAAAVYGKLALDFLGASATLDATSGLPTAAAALGTFESVWGSGDVESSAVNKGYRLKFVGDLAQYDIPEATLTPSTTYLLNDGTGTAPTKTSQRDYTAAVAEVFTLDVGGGGDGTVTTSSGGSVTCTGGPISAVNSDPVGFTLTSGGVGSYSATWTASVAEAKANETVASDGVGTSTITINTQGADHSNANVVLDVGSGAVGWIVYTSADLAGGFVAIASNASAATIEATLTAAGLSAPSVSKVGSVVTIECGTEFISYSSMTISGKTGAAVTAAITTVQNGANFWLPSLPWDAIYDLRYDVFSDAGSTPVTNGGTLQLAKNQRSRGTRDLSQSTSGARAVYHLGANGKPYLTFNGSKYYNALTIPCAAGLCTVHLLRFTATGYHNVFDNYPDASNVMMWVDGSGRFEVNADSAHPAGPYNDGAWHCVISHTAKAGDPSRNKLWVDGTLVVNATPGMNAPADLLVNLFNRATGGAPYNGDVGPFGFGSFDPAAYIADITAAALALAAT